MPNDKALKDLQAKIRDIKRLRDAVEKPAADAALSVARAKDAHVHDMERVLHAPERAKTFEQLVHRTAGHKAQAKQIDEAKNALHQNWKAQVDAHKVNEKRLQDEKHAKHAEYAKHNKDYHLLRGIERAHGVLKPEHIELLEALAMKSLSAEVKNGLR
jgi:hypothetical protein